MITLTLVETRDLAVVDRAAPEPDVGHVAVEVAAAPRAEAEAQRRPVRLAREVERRQAVACPRRNSVSVEWIAGLHRKSSLDVPMRSIFPPSARQRTRSIAVSDTLCHARFRAEFPASIRTDSQPPTCSNNSASSTHRISRSRTRARVCRRGIAQPEATTAPSASGVHGQA